MNPYAVERVEPAMELDASLVRDAHATARQLAAGGSVVGSISKKLEAKGIDSSLAYHIATNAVVARSRVERLRGVGFIAAGLSIVTLVFLLPWPFRARIHIGLLIFGGFMLMTGVVMLFQRSKLMRRQ